MRTHMLSNCSNLSLFPANDIQAARAAAIDILHSVTSLYTAGPIVERILDRLKWKPSDGCLADVSAGDGIFLGAALTRMLASTNPTDDEIIERLQGYEIHASAAAQARGRIEAILVINGRSATAARHVAERVVHNRDFLTEGPETPSFACIVGNPPFIRLLNVPEILRNDYVARVPRYATGDLLYAFLDRIVKTLHPTGELCMVSNDRWLFAKGAATLRRVIGERTATDGSKLMLQHVERLSAKSSFYRPKHRVKGTPPRISPVVVHLGFGAGRPLTEEPIYPGVDPAQYAHLPKLGDIATVTLSPWLGPDGIFLLTHDDAMLNDIPAEYLVPSVDARDVVDGILQEPKRYALLVNPDETPAPQVLAHLERAMPRMCAGGRRKIPWMPPESVHNRDLSKQSLLILRITNTAVPVRLPSGILPNDHHLTITCESDLDLSRIERALHGELATKWLAAHGSTLENGYFQVSAPILRQLPIELV